MIVVDDNLAVNLIQGNHTLGDLAGLAGTALHEHAVNPSVRILVERVKHREHGGEVAALEARRDAIVNAMEGVHAMALGRMHDTVARVPAFLVVDVVAGELHAHAVLVEDWRQSLVMLVLRRIKDIIIVGIIDSKRFDEDATIIGRIIILHDNLAASVTYYHILNSIK